MKEFDQLHQAIQTHANTEQGNDALRRRLTELVAQWRDAPRDSQSADSKDVDGRLALQAWQTSEKRLRQSIFDWRKTAQIWEDQELGRGAYYGSPVGNGKGNIQNWINWLRGCASEIESALPPPSSAEGEPDKS